MPPPVLAITAHATAFPGNTEFVALTNHMIQVSPARARSWSACASARVISVCGMGQSRTSGATKPSTRNSPVPHLNSPRSRSLLFVVDRRRCNPAPTRPAAQLGALRRCRAASLLQMLGEEFVHLEHGDLFFPKYLL